MRFSLLLIPQMLIFFGVALFKIASKGLSNHPRMRPGLFLLSHNVPVVENPVCNRAQFLFAQFCSVYMNILLARVLVSNL